MRELSASRGYDAIVFSAVAGYLAGLIGGSNSRFSSLTLSALLIAAVLMVAVGLTDIQGVAGGLGVAGVICCATGIAGYLLIRLPLQKRRDEALPSTRLD